MMGNTVFNRNNQNLVNENLRAQYKLIEDNMNKDKMKDDFEKLSLSVRNQNNRLTTDMYNMRNDVVDVQNQNNRFNTDIYDMQNDFNNVKKQGFSSIQFLTNQLNSLKKKYINDQNGSFANTEGSSVFKGKEDRLLISHETNINNNNDEINNPTGLIEPIDTNINTVEEENNRILSDQSNNMNSNEGANETKEEDEPSTKTRVKTPEQIKKMHDELKQIQQEYYNLYKAINKNDLTKINKRLMESKDLKDLKYVKRAFKNFKNKHDI